MYCSEMNKYGLQFSEHNDEKSFFFFAHDNTDIVVFPGGMKTPGGCGVERIRGTSISVFRHLPQAHVSGPDGLRSISHHLPSAITQEDTLKPLSSLMFALRK